jgi:hypothetical protein
MDLLNHLKYRAKGITLSILAVGFVVIPAIKEYNNLKTDLSDSLYEPTVISCNNQGDLVDVSYRQFYKSTFKDINKYEIKELTDKVILSYNFVNAKQNEK